MAFVLEYIGVDSIILDQAVQEIFYFKHDVDASLIIVFIHNPDVETSALYTLLVLS